MEYVQPIVGYNVEDIQGITDYMEHTQTFVGYTKNTQFL